MEMMELNEQSAEKSQPSVVSSEVERIQKDIYEPVKEDY
jgi:hypothetical protein